MDASNQEKNERIWGQEFKNLKKEGFIGNSFTLEDFSSNNSLREALIKANGIASSKLTEEKLKLAQTQPDEMTYGKTQEFIWLAHSSGVVGYAIQPMFLSLELTQKSLLIGLIEEFKKRGIPIEDFVDSPKIEQLISGQK